MKTGKGGEFAWEKAPALHRREFFGNKKKKG